jgi:hypothetical protein
MLEFLVASLCIGDYGCDKALKAYYYERPHIKAFTRSVKDTAERYAGESITYAVPALAAASLGRPFQIKITKKISCGAAQDDVTCLYRYDF